MAAAEHNVAPKTVVVMIDALSIIKVGMEHTLTVDILAVLKVGRVPIEVDGWPLVVDHRRRIDTAQSEVVELAHRINTANGIVGIQAETRRVGAHLDVLRHLERDCETSIGHGNPTTIEHILVEISRVVIIGAIKSPDFGLLVEKPDPQLAVELRIGAAIDVNDLTFHGDHAQGMKFYLIVSYVLPIDGSHHNFLLRHGKTDGRVAEKEETDV